MSGIRPLWLEMKAVLRSARLIINAGLTPLQLTGAEGDILFHLLTGSNESAQEELARQLDIGKAAISRVVDSLEAKGYVLRMKSARDKRAYSICLTEKGHSIGKDIVGIYETLYRQVKSAIADDELRMIESLLKRVSIQLNKMGEQ